MIESASGSRSGGLIRVIKKITHTQLLTIATTPFVIVPATETPNYGSNLTKVPVIVNGFIQGNNFAVNYSNVDDNGFGQIWLGSDLGSNIVSTQIHKSTFLSGDAGSVFTNRFLINSSDINN